jgi:signal transduction histidine kinase
LYAIFAGLVPPPVEFFPGNIVNSVTFTQVVGFPPLVIRSLIGLVLALTMFRALEVFDVESARMIEAMEQQQILNAERERIGRVLHDGAIQTVYTAGLLVESAAKLADPGSQVAGRLEKAVVVLNDAIRDLRLNLGDLRPNPCEESLTVALRDLTSDPRVQSMVDISLNLDLPETEAPSPACTEHIIAIVGEALTNVIRHAQARQVEVNVRLVDGRLIVTVQDDGEGLPSELEAGYGLRNMRDRARLLDGQLELAGANGNGTRIELDIPWEEAE